MYSILRARHYVDLLYHSSRLRLFLFQVSPILPQSHGKPEADTKSETF